MALAERATLIAELRLDDKMSRGLRSATGSLASFSKRAGLSSKNLQTLGTNLARIGAIAAAGIGAAVASGISTLADLEDANTATAGALKATGLAAKINADQVRAWSEELETASDALVDDKAIQRAANTLIRFGDISEDSLRQAMEIATDLAPKFGTVEQAADALAKSLVDPTTATRILKQAGVTLTTAEKKKIKALKESGKIHQAQAIILDKLTEKTKGAAAAAGGPYRDSLNKLQDAAEDAKKALGEGFLPVISKVADKLSKAVADPKVMAGIREFGQSLSKGLDSLLSIAEKLPWGAIADSMKVAGAGAKTLLEAFTKLPPWVQTAVLTGWGLNKLTGGALSGIVGELGKGLIRGVLGMNAGVVNINAGVVNGAGGVPGVAPAAGGAAAGAGGFLAPGLGAAIAGAAVPLIMVGLIPRLFQNKGFERGISPETNPAQIGTAAWRTVGNNILTLTGQVKEGNEAIQDGAALTAGHLAEIQDRIRDTNTDTARAAAVMVARIGTLTDMTRAKGDATAGAIRSNTSTLAAKNFAPQITVRVSNNVSVRQIQSSLTVNSRYSTGGLVT